MNNPAFPQGQGRKARPDLLGRCSRRRERREKSSREKSA
jgi:hypothetical protein